MCQLRHCVFLQEVKGQRWVCERCLDRKLPQEHSSCIMTLLFFSCPPVVPIHSSIQPTLLSFTPPFLILRHNDDSEHSRAVSVQTIQLSGRVSVNNGAENKLVGDWRLIPGLSGELQYMSGVTLGNRFPLLGFGGIAGSDQLGVSADVKGSTQEELRILQIMKSML